MIDPSKIESLQIFIDSAGELEASNFVAQAEAGISTSMWQLKDKAVLLGRKGPEHEAVKALLLTLRFFYQDNEISIKKTGTLIESLVISPSLNAEFSEIRDKLNSYLDVSSPIQFQTGVGAETNREIFETFLLRRPFLKTL